jgi:hypothetical protein
MQEAVVTSIPRFVSWLWLAAALTLAGAAPAQDLRYFVPEKIERATATDDKGLTQWAEYKPEKCGVCAGTGKMKCVTCERFPDDVKTCPECKRVESRETACRTCAGVGHLPDPLEKSFCPGCRGAGFLLCLVCSGGGQIKGSGDKRWSDCPACRGSGGWKCGVCDGNRLVEVVGLKPSLRDASATNLDKALAATDKALAGLAAFTPEAKNTRKEVKELVKQLQIAQQHYAPLKRTPKVLEDYMGKLAAGAMYQGHAQQEANAMHSVRSSAEYYLKLQKRIMELAKQRAEANAKVEAENKPK